MTTNIKSASVISEAKKEIEKEISTKYKGEYKDLLRKRQKAQLVVDNIDREIEDLELKIANELS